MENHNQQLPACPVCANALLFRIAKGRKSNKPFIMLMCPLDGRHFRGFIGDRDYIKQVMEKLEAKTQSEEKV
ncbi:MAG: hypothetical protein PHU23_16635 [Dehalococcoidales bacterium]|nr:hypothetical protein [Dehalococcoidales bacterium]